MILDHLMVMELTEEQWMDNLMNSTEWSNDPTFFSGRSSGYRQNLHYIFQ